MWKESNETKRKKRIVTCNTLVYLNTKSLRLLFMAKLEQVLDNFVKNLLYVEIK
ncbi:hypothetical protein Hanom_Chr06g00489661 [Helianthus anomalus]